MTVSDIDVCQDWGGITGVMGGFVRYSMYGLESIGIVRNLNKSDKQFWLDKFELVSTEGFTVEYQAPSVPTPIKTLDDLEAENKRDYKRLSGE